MYYDFTSKLKYCISVGAFSKDEAKFVLENVNKFGDIGIAAANILSIQQGGNSLWCPDGITMHECIKIANLVINTIENANIEDIASMENYVD